MYIKEVAVSKNSLLLTHRHITFPGSKLLNKMLQNIKNKIAQRWIKKRWIRENYTEITKENKYKNH